MVKKIMIEFDDVDFDGIIEAKGTLTWKELFLKGVEKVNNDNV
ncbi:MAG: hypothetical protein Unbinned1693contig1002_23 [Prokaryotic dsDNA virus sp.]|jgi:hypothetical protein|nr:MAG: hypothetical protein Unbinned1693contig1002_23 [Prokaryotic dsDNA virus sp.]|tara:strand:+ start:2727 stop:2855 length:129 start_codon:yes stop_codon:yes gene_type:complete